MFKLLQVFKMYTVLLVWKSEKFLMFQSSIKSFKCLIQWILNWSHKWNISEKLFHPHVKFLKVFRRKYCANRRMQVKHGSGVKVIQICAKSMEVEMLLTLAIMTFKYWVACLRESFFKKDQTGQTCLLLKVQFLLYWDRLSQDTKSCIMMSNHNQSVSY